MSASSQQVSASPTLRDLMCIRSFGLEKSSEMIIDPTSPNTDLSDCGLSPAEGTTVATSSGRAVAFDHTTMAELNSSPSVHRKSHLPPNPSLVSGQWWKLRGLNFRSWQGELDAGEEKSVNIGFCRRLLSAQGAAFARALQIAPCNFFPLPPNSPLMSTVGGPVRLSSAIFRPCIDITGHPPVEDEFITLLLSDHKGLRGFVEQRSVLALCPVFCDFFRSRFYQPGCATTIWLGYEHAPVLSVILKYLLGGYGSVTFPSMKNLDIGDRPYLKIRLCYLARRLRLSHLEDIAVKMLTETTEVNANDIVDMAKVIYADGKDGYSDLNDHQSNAPIDSRIRLFFNRLVELNIRNLLQAPAWRSLIQRGGQLGADMFDLLGFVLVEGESPSYPLTLCPPVPRQGEGFTPLGPNYRAIVLRAHDPFTFNKTPDSHQLRVVRGNILHSISIGRDTIIGTNIEGHQGFVPTDHVCIRVFEDTDLHVLPRVRARFLNNKVSYPELGIYCKAKRVLGVSPLSLAKRVQQKKSNAVDSIKKLAMKVSSTFKREGTCRREWSKIENERENWNDRNYNDDK